MMSDKQKTQIALTGIVMMAAILIYMKTVEAKMKESKKSPKKP
jgi:hypothetical protein